MKRRAILLGAVAALALGGSAQAGNFHGLYVGIEGGGNWVQDADLFSELGPFGAPTFSSDAVVHYDAGWAVMGTVGYDFGQWRIEGEAGYRDNQIDFATYPGLGGLALAWTDPSMSELTVFANVLYDIQLAPWFTFSLGAGAGGDFAKFDTGGGFFDDSDWSFAYQGIAELSFALASRTDLTFAYRYLHVSEPEFSEERGIPDVLNSYDDISKHAVTIGLRYDLTPEQAPMVAPPPAQPMAPPPAAPKQFIVFFGFDKCNITAEADGVLGEAANTAKSLGSASVRIVGHTDTSGSPSYNQNLSECRANAAKTNLVSKGIQDGAISTSGRGEAELMVQTGDSVKEPQNRRATIDLQ